MKIGQRRSLNELGTKILNRPKDYGVETEVFFWALIGLQKTKGIKVWYPEVGPIPLSNFCNTLPCPSFSWIFVQGNRNPLNHQSLREKLFPSKANFHSIQVPVSTVTFS